MLRFAHLPRPEFERYLRLQERAVETGHTLARVDVKGETFQLRHKGSGELVYVTDDLDAVEDWLAD
jgi:hypothetical protein